MEVTIFITTIAIFAIIFALVVVNPYFDVIIKDNQRYRIMWYNTNHGRDYVILWKK